MKTSVIKKLASIVIVAALVMSGLVLVPFGTYAEEAESPLKLSITAPETGKAPADAEIEGYVKDDKVVFTGSSDHLDVTPMSDHVQEKVEVDEGHVGFRGAYKLFDSEDGSAASDKFNISGKTPFYIGFWMKEDAPGGTDVENRYIIGKMDNQYGVQTTQDSSTGAAYIQVYSNASGGGWPTYVSSKNDDLTKWNYVAVLYDGHKYWISVNDKGELDFASTPKGSASTDFAIADQNSRTINDDENASDDVYQKFTIGYNFKPSNARNSQKYYNGLLADVDMYIGSTTTDACASADDAKALVETLKGGNHILNVEAVEKSPYTVTTKWSKVDSSDAVETFEDNTSYTVTVTMTADEGKDFTFTEAMKPTAVSVGGEDINLEEGAVTLSDDKKTMTVTYTFEAAQEEDKTIEGLVGYYTFEDGKDAETFKNVAEVSEENTANKTHDAVNSNATVSDEGVSGSSIMFSGSPTSTEDNQHLEIANAYRSLSPATFSFWIKPSSEMISENFNGTTGGSIIHDVFNPSTGRPIVLYRAYEGVNKVGTFIMGEHYWHNGTEDEVPSVDPEQWNHIAVTIDPDTKTMKFYVNGQITSTQLMSGDFVGSSSEDQNYNSIYVGAHREGKTNYKGLLDNLRIYKNVVSDEMIADIYKMEKPDWNVAVDYADGSDSAQGTVAVKADGSDIAKAGHMTEVTFTATAKNGYEFKGWFSDKEATVLLSGDAEYTVSVQKPITAYAKFEQGERVETTLTVNPSKASLITLEQKATFNAVISPAEDDVVYSWTIDGNEDGLVELSGEETAEVTVTPVKAGKGTVTLNVTATKGEDVNLTAQATIEVNIPEAVDIVKVDPDVLGKNAGASSSYTGGASTTDGGAEWAFDDEDHWWHSFYNTGKETEGHPSEDNPIWIQTGFDETRDVYALVYQPRDGGNNIIKDYEILYTDATEAPSDSKEWKSVKKSVLVNTENAQMITLSEPVKATFVRIVITSVQGQNDGKHVTAKYISVLAKKSDKETEVTYDGIEIAEGYADEYKVGEAFNREGMQITAKFGDGKTAVVIPEDVTISELDSSTPGTKTLYVTYLGKSTTITVNVTAAPTLENITVKAPTKTEYKIGDELDTTGMVVTAHYSDDSEVDVTKDATLSKFDSSTAGEKTITVTYQDKTAEFKVTVVDDTTVEATLESITVKAPTKTEYKIGDELDTTGMVVTAHYSDDSEVDVTKDATLSKFDSTTAGEKTITVTYQGKTATFKVTVTEDSEVVLDSIEVSATKTEYKKGEELDKSTIKVTAKYSDGSTKDVSVDDVEISGYDADKAGEQEVTVTYNGKTATFKVTVTEDSEIVLDSIEVSATKTEYKKGEELDKSTIKVTAKYSDGSTKDVSVDDVEISGYDANKVGEQIVTVTYNGKTATFKVTVADDSKPDVTLESIEVSATKTTYKQGDALDMSTIKVTAKYSDGTTKDVTADAVITGYDANKLGEQTVTVTYEGKTATFTVNVTVDGVPVVLEGISVTMPEKTTYVLGEELDLSGMVVTAKYSDGTTKDVTADAVVTGYDANKLGEQTITVTYGDKSVTFTVTVKEAADTTGSVPGGESSTMLAIVLLLMTVSLGALTVGTVYLRKKNK